MNLKAYEIPERYKRGTAKGTSGSSSSSSFYERLADAKYKRELRKAYQDYSKMYNEQEALYQAEQEAQKELTQEEIERQEAINDSNFFERLWQTKNDLQGNILYGAARTVEGVVDLSIAVFGKDTEENRQRIIKDWSQENIKSKYDEKTKASYIDSNTEFGQGVEGVAQGLGQLGVQAGVSLIPGVGQVASMGTIALSGAGSGVEEAYKEGATKGQALTYGTIMGATEVLSEKLLNIGPMKKIFGKGLLNDSASKFVSKFASKFAQTTFGKIAGQFASEGLEEVFSDLVNPLAKYITYQASQGKDFEMWSWKELVNSFIIGGTVASIAGGGSTIVGSTEYGSRKIYNDMDNITNLTNKMYDTLQKQEGVVSTEEIDKFNTDMAELYAQLESDLNAYGAKANLSESQNEKRLAKQREKLDKLNKQLEKRTGVKDTFSIEEDTNKLVGNENIAMNFDPRLEGFVNVDRNYRSKGKIEGEDVTLGNITLQSSKKLSKEQMKKVQKAAKVLNAFNNANLFEGQQRKVVFSDSKDIFKNETKDTIENGYYDPNNNTIYINLNSEKPLDFVLGHEFAHSVENMDLHEIAKKEEPLEVRKKKNKLRNSSSDLRNFVTNLIKTDKYFRDYFNTYTQEHADRKELYADYLKNRSKKVVDRYIDEEIVADFVGKYLTNDRFLNKLKGQDRSLIQKFADYFRNLRQTKGLSKEEKQYIKEVEEKFTNLLESPLPYEVISETKDGTPIAIKDKGQIRYNIVTYLNGGRAMIEDELLRKKHKRSEIDKFLMEMDEMVRFTKELRDKYPIIANSQNMELNTDNEGHVIASAWVKNGDYKFNIDLTTICKKREPFTKTLDYILKEVDLNTVELTPAKIAELNKLLQEKGVETACPLCFVDAKRYNLSNWASKIRNDWNRLASYNDQQLKDYIAQEDNEIKEGKKEKVSKLYKVAKDMLKNPSIKKKLTLEQIMSSDFMTNAERYGNKTLVYWAKNAYGQATPKPIKEYQPYNNEILDRKKTSRIVKSASDKVGGVRLFSFSDFKIEDFFDYVQMFSNLAAKQLKLQAYVKEISFIEIFGMTGAKINASLVPKVQIIYKDGKIDVDATKKNAGLDENGNFIYDEKHSIDDKLIFDLMQKDGYRGNIGTVLVGISDKHIEKALNDDRISMVIPYHKSSINAIVAEMFQINYYKDYTEFQTTKNPNPEYKYNKKGKKVEVKFKDFDFYGDLNKTNDPRTTANNYLKWCDEKGYIPKFPQFRDEKNYYKLLIDFNVYDGDTYAPQQDVQMKFPENFQQIVEKYVSERQDQVNRQNKIVDEIKDDAVGILTKKSISKKPQLEVKRSISKKSDVEIDDKFDSELDKLLKEVDELDLEDISKDLDNNYVKPTNPRDKYFEQYEGWEMVRDDALSVSFKDAFKDLVDIKTGDGFEDFKEFVESKMIDYPYNVGDRIVDLYQRKLNDIEKVQRRKTGEFKSPGFIKRGENTVEKLQELRSSGKTALYSDERIKGLIEESSSTYNKNYTKNYTTMISPQEFLELTLPKLSEGFLSETKPLDVEKLKEQQSRGVDSLILYVDMNNGEVTGHEGRHRMYALMKAGYTNVQIVIQPDRMSHNKQTSELKLPKYFKSQYFGWGQNVVASSLRIPIISEIKPLNYNNEENLLKENNSKKYDIKFSVSKKSKPEVSEEVREKVNANKNKTREKDQRFYNKTYANAAKTNLKAGIDEMDMILTEDLKYASVTYQDLYDNSIEKYKNIKLRESNAQVNILLDKLLSNKEATAQDAMDALVLANKCREIGKVRESVDLMQALSNKGSSAGQFISTLGSIKYFTPEGKLQMLRNTVNKMNKEIDTSKISKQQRRYIKDRMEKYFEMDIQTMKEVEIRSVLEFYEYKGNNAEKIVRDIKKINEIDRAKFKESVIETLNKYISDTDYVNIVAEEYTDSYFENLEKLTEMYESPSVLIPETLARKLIYSENEEQQKKAFREIEKALNEQKQVGFWDKIDSYRMLAMLFNPKTHFRNIGSNFVMGQISKISSNYVQNFVESAAIKFGILNENERTTTLKKVDSRDYIYAQKLGDEIFDEIKFETSKYQKIPEGTTVFENKLLEKVRIMNNNLLENVEDKSAFVKTFANRFSKWMTANNYTEEFLNKEENLKIKKKGIEIAQQEALEATFKDFSVLVQSINKLKANSKVAKFLISAIMPFTKTPINVARRGIQYSPVGLAISISNIKKVKSGEISVNEWISNMSKGLTGSMITMLGIFLAKLGLVTGGGSGSDKEDKYLEYQGQKSFSLVIGDKSYTLDWLAPASIPFFTGVELYNTIENKINKKSKGEDDTDGSSLGAYFDIMFKTLDPLTEMSFIKSINDALSSYDDNKMGGALKSAYQNYLSSFQPTVLAQAAKVIEKSRRSLTGTKDSEYFGNYLMSRVPFYSTALEPYIDVWGNEDSEASLITKFNENLVYPWWVYEKKEETSKVDDEIMRLYKMTGNTKILPSIPKYYYSKNNVKYEMTDEEYTEYRRNYGQFNYKALNSLFSSSYYKNLSDEEKESAIESIYDLGTKYAQKNKIYYVANALGEKNASRVATYLANISNITSLRDKNGKVISGSKKTLTFEYINSIKSLSKVQKQLLYSYAGYYNPSYYTSIKKYLKEQGYTTQEILILLNEFNIKEVE